jgi:hypothetical protein
MSYYSSLKKMVLSKLEHYQDDLLIHDKKALNKYEGDFLYGYRKYGTNLLTLDLKGYSLEKDLVTQLCNSVIWLKSNNQHFLYGKNGKIQSIQEEEIEHILQNYQKDVLIPFQELVKKLNIPLIAQEISFFIKKEGKAWKSKLANLWENGGADANLQRLRNRFDLKVLKQIKQDMEESEIKTLLYANILKG